MDLSSYNRPRIEKSAPRNSREALNEDIVAATDEKAKGKLCRALAVTAKTLE